MKRRAFFAFLSLPLLPAAAREPAFNPAIDMEGFLRVSAEAARHRSTRRVSEAEFIRMSREPGVVILDARSRDSFPDIAVATLQAAIPDTATRILIYCNNNFRGAEQPFPTKIPVASLNLSTYVALYSYGYRNIYELAPQIDLASSRLVFESSRRPD
jgi:hypothetical protein